MKNKSIKKFIVMLMGVSIGFSIVIILECIFTLLSNIGIYSVQKDAKSIGECICYLFITIPNIILIANKVKKWDEEEDNNK